MSSHSRLRLWLNGLLPLVLLAVLTAVFLKFGPLGVFRAAFPPIEELTIERIRFPQEGELEVRLVNGGPEAVTVAQLIIDEAYWPFTIEPGVEVGRLESATMKVEYPWVDGDPLVITVLTNTGLTFTREVEVATRSPEPSITILTRLPERSCDLPHRPERRLPGRRRFALCLNRGPKRAFDTPISFFSFHRRTTADLGPAAAPSR